MCLKKSFALTGNIEPGSIISHASISISLSGISESNAIFPSRRKVVQAQLGMTLARNEPTDTVYQSFQISFASGWRLTKPLLVSNVLSKTTVLMNELL